ncbi:lipid-A-disaccharide synthase N-terminal domain-containing protein, partial [Alphaproteobacteria bacterium]|nr:lipid-A-disaccharide synthase N-terminal domain-containing protein [Alphaproteobacteria bacterium]
MDFISAWFFPGGIETNEAILLLVGFIGQGLFSARFLIQWVASEKKKE